MTVGPLEYLVIGFEGNTFDGSIAREVGKVVDKGIIRLVDVVLLTRDAEGAAAVVKLGNSEDLRLAPVQAAPRPARCYPRGLSHEMIVPRPCRGGLIPSSSRPRCGEWGGDASREPMTPVWGPDPRGRLSSRASSVAAVSTPRAHLASETLIAGSPVAASAQATDGEAWVGRAGAQERRGAAPPPGLRSAC